VRLTDPEIPVGAEITGWSPFIPGDADLSSLPVAALEYNLLNTSDSEIDAVYSFHAKNFMAAESPGARVDVLDGGFLLCQSPLDKAPWNEGYFAARLSEADAKVDCAWFRGGWFDTLTMLWKIIASGETQERKPHADGKAGPGASLYLPLKLSPGKKKTVRLLLSWYVPESRLNIDWSPANGCSTNEDVSKNVPRHSPWYAGKFENVETVSQYWHTEYENLRKNTAAFTECFYDTDLPAEVVEAVAANLTILKSPTVLRQEDGRIWAWEGCKDEGGCCHGTCTHVWNYAQALPHLFSSLERTIRQTEFNECQDGKGHQCFRAPLPIRDAEHDFGAAADGQLGGVMKVYRDWRISGDTEWMENYWPVIRKSLDYCIETWDPERLGALIEPHHNTYDIEFWGSDGMCTSFYLGALTAAVRMGEALREDISEYRALAEKSCRFLEEELFNGEYFIQKVMWKGLGKGKSDKASISNTEYSPEAKAIFEKEGPKYQYGNGCLPDGVLGAWMAKMCGLGDILDGEKVESHLRVVRKYNFRENLSTHANPQRPGFALGEEGGLLLCTWPGGGEPSLPFVYSSEVWTGIEYQVASHLMTSGRVEEGLEIVRAARDRYDGSRRNPFDEYECGHWYARAMASYALLQGLTGARYDAVEKILYLEPSIDGDFRAFISTATGFGTVGVRGGKPFLEVRHGKIEIAGIEYRR
jgi:uncharacterized protein (DUF608 family)